MSGRHSKKVRGDWRGNECFDQHVGDYVRSRRFESDMDAAAFFEVEPAKRSHIFRALERLVSGGRLRKQPHPQKPGVFVYSVQSQTRS